MKNNNEKTELKIKDIDSSLKSKFKNLTHKKNSNMKKTLEDFMKFCIIHEEINVEKIFEINKKDIK